MQRRYWKGLFIGMCALLAGAPAMALTIGFQPSEQTVKIGDSLELDILAGLSFGEIVSAFDFDVSYNSSVLKATEVAFSNSLGVVNNSEAIGASNLTTPGLVDFAEVSLLSDSDLGALQSSSTPFTLATISFDAIGLGNSPLEFINNGVAGNVITGANNIVLSPTVEPGAVDVTSVSVVPEAPMWLLFSSGLLFVGYFGRKRDERWWGFSACD